MAKLPRTKSTKCTTEIKLRFCSRASRRARRLQEKTGRKIKSFSRVEVRSCDPESVRGRYEARGVNASFSLLFSWQPFCVFLPSTIPPFQSADAEGCEEFEMNSTSLTNGSVTITFFLSNIFLACLKIFLLARAR